MFLQNLLGVVGKMPGQKSKVQKVELSFCGDLVTCIVALTLWKCGGAHHNQQFCSNIYRHGALVPGDLSR
jgi:hypothetical protein